MRNVTDRLTKVQRGSHNSCFFLSARPLNSAGSKREEGRDKSHDIHTATCVKGTVLWCTSPRWPHGKASTSRAADLGSIPAFPVFFCLFVVVLFFFSGRVMPVT